MGVPRPGGRQSGVAKRLGGRLGDLGALHHPNGEDQRGQILVSGKGLLPGNTFLAATDSALNDPQKRAALQDYLQRLAGAERWAYANLDSYGKTLGRSSASRRRSPGRSLPTASRSGSRWPRKQWPSSRQRRTLSHQRPDPHPAGREADL